MSRRADKEEAAHLQYETEHTEPGQGKSVIPYLVVLVVAAFLLLLMAYLMQQRTADTVQGLHESVSSIQSINQVIEDNQALLDQVTQLESERDALAEQVDELQRQLEAARNDPDTKNRVQVLTLFATLEQALRDKNYDLAAEKARLLCRGDLELDLGIAGQEDGDHFSPRERLEEIVPLLVRQGALKKDEVAIP